jgi:hypothetical protein
VTRPSRIAFRLVGVLSALVLLAAFSSVVLSAPSGVPDQEHTLSGESLAAALKRGGYVIYFRHADTGPAYLEQGVDLKRCETQRNLNDNGREEAKLMGAHFCKLNIPVGYVRACVFCRCR